MFVPRLHTQPGTPALLMLCPLVPAQFTQFLSMSHGHVLVPFLTFCALYFNKTDHLVGKDTLQTRS